MKEPCPAKNKYISKSVKYLHSQRKFTNFALSSLEERRTWFAAYRNCGFFYTLTYTVIVFFQIVGLIAFINTESGNQSFFRVDEFQYYHITFYKP